MKKLSSAMIPSSQKWKTLPWLLMFFFLFTTFSLSSVLSSPTQLSKYYEDHCSKSVPRSSQKKVPLTNFPLARSHTGFYNGGNPFLDPNPDLSWSTFSNSLLLRTLAVYDTDIQGLFKFQGRLTFQTAYKNEYRQDLSYSQYSYFTASTGISSQRSSITFELEEGYWSEPKGKLCMVGSASAYTEEGKRLNLYAVLNLNNVTSSTTITSLITGTLESLSSAEDPAHFESISMLILPQKNYKFLSVPDDNKNEFFGGSDLPQGLSLSSLPEYTFCSLASKATEKFNLRYASDCKSSTNCTPFDADFGYLPRIMYLYGIECSGDKEKMRVLIEFPNQSRSNSTRTRIDYRRILDPKTTLVGEGSWDESKHQLYIVACRFMGITESLAHARVGDCSTKLSLRFPSIWSIRDASMIVGQIWTNKTVKESGYSNRIMLHSSRNDRMEVPEPTKYKYTKIDTAMKLCSKSKKIAKTNEERYPNGDSASMSFDISLTNSEGTRGWANVAPISVGDHIYGYSSFQDSTVPPSFGSGLVKISYRIHLNTITRKISPFHTENSSSYISRSSWEIVAEGLYDAETGSLCMVGCRNLDSDNQTPRADFLDCEILITFDFPPINTKKTGYIKGSINSTRKKSDPLYFEHLDLRSAAFYEDGSSIWRMDVEIIMVIISTSMSCVFVALQIFHVNRHPDVLPLISFAMLSILTLGQLIPLVLNFEALFLSKSGVANIWLDSGRRIETNEVIVRVTGMIAFLLQFRFLQRIWSAKWAGENQKGLWVVEKKALFVALPLYIAGALVAMAFKWWMWNGKNSATSYDQPHSQYLWEALKSYSGLVLDGFLLPQILLNIFWNSRTSALAISFYMGNTFVRLLPHAYDLYRAHNYFQHYDGSFIYANLDEDFYSTAWDVGIPIGGLLFALIIFLQQRFGGRCIFPQRFRELQVYEKVPVTSE